MCHRVKNLALTVLYAVKNLTLTVLYAVKNLALTVLCLPQGRCGGGGRRSDRGSQAASRAPGQLRSGGTVVAHIRQSRPDIRQSRPDIRQSRPDYKTVKARCLLVLQRRGETGRPRQSSCSSRPRATTSRRYLLLLLYYSPA